MQFYKKENFTKKNQNIISKQEKLFLIIKKNQEFYINQVNSYLSELNVLNANYLWWSFNLSSKSLLSTTIVGKIIDVLGVLDLEGEDLFNLSDYQNFSNGQKKVLFKYFKIKKKFIYFHLFITSFKRIIDFFKAALRLVQIFTFFIVKKTNKKKYNILLFTFIDGTNRKQNDPYFGNLDSLIKEHNPEKLIGYLYYLYRPFHKMSKILKDEKIPYNYIFSYLKLQDYFWCFIQIIKVYFLKIKEVEFKHNCQSILFNKIVRETMLDEIPRGIIENLLLFKACKRLNANESLEKIIYPFENKSLEKLLLLGLPKKIRTIGYQHSSITPMHLSFQLSKKEIYKMPLPDKIVTVGKVTQKWLVKRCNFPSQKILQGVALRTFQNKPLNGKMFIPKKAKLLFVFSSSIDEIIKTIEFLEEIPKSYKYVYKFRFHTNFPINLLDQNFQDWININVHFISNDNLYDEFKWADIMVYLSSSAAIESLLCCLPVIRLNIDKFNLDPFLNHKTSLKTEVKSSREFIQSIFEISNLKKSEKKKMALSSKKFAESYMVPQENFNSKMFF